ncbi:uncharacterized protein LOC126982878 isoform X3 [Eriocheir sinensis]|uniref:uncharacterized protein LOC126982878 isoform X3 n=1 Tax=Eriocheir sinensis TaxID=95602 RepID=UPI0021C9D2D8|nr:uncharacterized protein LOC126982878 isoform X3 [Eriocheir sinensis]
MHTRLVAEAAPGASAGAAEVPLFIHPDEFHAPPEDHDGGASGASLGLGLLIAMVTAALAIAIIALLISKMRRRQNTDSTDIELEVPTDPYMEAIMFPTEPRPEWHRHLRQVLNKAGQKIFKKSESHDTTIPENLRHQLKHIYVY